MQSRLEEVVAARESAPARAQVNQILSAYLVLLAFLSFTQWLSVARAFWRKLPWRGNSSLFDSAARFSDWTNFVPYGVHFSQPGLLTRADIPLPYPYPLPSVFLYVSFTRLFSHSLVPFLLTSVGLFVLSAVVLSIALKRRQPSPIAKAAVWLTLLLGNPALFCLDRGNIEVFLWFNVLLGTICFLRKWPFAAAILFAIAASMKIYPALMFLLFLPRRQYKAFVLAMVSAASISIAALAAVGPTIPQAIADMARSARYLTNAQIVPLAQDSLMFDHSLLGALKTTIFQVGLRLHHYSLNDPPHFAKLVPLYSFFAPAAFLMVYLFRIRGLPLLNQYFCLTLLSILLPYVSYEYTLIQVYSLFGVWLLYLLDDAEPTLFVRSRPLLMVMSVSFALVIAPIAVLTGAWYQGLVKSLLLLVLLACALWKPMPSTLFDDRLRECRV